MLEVYYKPKKNVIHEQAFADALINLVQPDHIITEYYPIPAEMLQNSLRTAEIIKWVAHSGLSPKRVSALIQQLQKCPSELCVAVKQSQITCDIVMVGDGVPHYYEFHEKQHSRLSVNRPAKVYSIGGEPITVPRYVQRLLRDIWRVKYLRPFTVVWADWFEQHGVDDMQWPSEGYSEFHLPEAINFADCG